MGTAELQPATLPDEVQPQLRTVLVCDLVDSTGLVERLGDVRATDLIRRHDRLAREAMARHGAREIDKTDGFLLLFDRPIDALAFALDYQRNLAALGEEWQLKLGARVGIHVGEVLVWSNAERDVAAGAKPLEVEGLAKNVAARLMALAHGGQVLLSETAYTLAQRAGDELEARGCRPLWLSHGRYRLKGLRLPLAVFEVGEADIAPGRRPRDSAKAQRLRPWWRSKQVLAALLLLGMLLGGFAWWQQRPAELAFAERDWVVLGDFVSIGTEAGDDTALRTALRIGLEQSRYVNVFADGATRETLQRMTLPADARIDRRVGTELAQRLGARALLLPSITTLGDKLRITVELVDPVTGVTVHGESAEANDRARLLPAIDRVVAGVRRSLRESLASIEASSPPLQQVTTRNLDALRAYALAIEANNARRAGDALQLVEHALQLDPEFAMALSLKAMLQNYQGERAAGHATALRALALGQRLSTRERLTLEAIAAFIADEPDAVQKWELLTRLHPDEYRAHYNAAWLELNQRNDIAAAQRRLQPALVAHNPLLRRALYLAGALALASDELDAAPEHFQAAIARGIGGDQQDRIFAHLARGELDVADAIYRAQGSVSSSDDPFDFMAGISLALEQGDRALALRRADQLGERAQALGVELLPREFRLIRLGLECIAGEPLGELALREEHAAYAAMDLGFAPRRRHRDMRILMLAMLAMRCGQPALARQLEALTHSSRDIASPALRYLRLLYDAEAALAAGDARRARDIALGALDGRELVAQHAQLARIADALGDAAARERELAWLQAHRGRAYAEFGDMLSFLFPLNTAERQALRR